MTSFTLAPSLLSADFARLGEEAQAVLSAGADRLHLDVMDNHYVPNLTVGPLVLTALRNYGINAPIDVHLMTQPVDTMIEQFAKAGANSISFHPEASLHVDRSLALIRDLGCKAGLALNPASSIDWLTHTLDRLDLVLMMSVNPGFGGQAFIPSTLSKIATVRKLLNHQERKIELAVDGGVKLDNIQAIATAGADYFVIGSAIFNSPPYDQTIAAFRHKLAEVNHNIK